MLASTVEFTIRKEVNSVELPSRQCERGGDGVGVGAVVGMGGRGRLAAEMGSGLGGGRGGMGGDWGVREGRLAAEMGKGSLG